MRFEAVKRRGIVVSTGALLGISNDSISKTKISNIVSRDNYLFQSKGNVTKIQFSKLNKENNIANKEDKNLQNNET